MSEERFDRIEARLDRLEAGQEALRAKVGDLRRYMGVLHEEVLDRIAACSARLRMSTGGPDG